MPNSLIFVVILAVWAAYLIQHWIRRRDHVATAKSVDRFSEAMRVLERRQSMPRADLSAPAPRSYSISLTRPAHPEVVVKRAQHGAVPVPASRPAAKASRRRIAAPSVAMLRAIALALGAVVLIGGVTASVTQLMDWRGAAIGVAGMLLALTFVRFSVGSARRRATSPVRATRPQTSRPQAARPSRATSARTSAARSVSATARSATARPGRAERPAARQPRGSRPAPRRMRPAAEATPVAQHVQRSEASRSVELYDVEAFDAPAAAAPVTAEQMTAQHLEQAATSTEATPGSWSPVPVPPPTYTLKARADRGAGPASTAPQSAGRGRAEVENLPFDGHALALEEEFEELPAVHRVV